MITRVIAFLCASFAVCISTFSYAQPSFLAAEQAFQFSAQSVSEKQAALSWKIAPHYYLYHDQFKVSVNQHPLKLQIPQGQQKNDPTFGMTFVHYDQVNIDLAVKPNTQYAVSWQGCSADGLCYSLQHQILQTDATGLLPQNEPTPHGLLKNNLNSNQENNLLTSISSNETSFHSDTLQQNSTENVAQNTEQNTLKTSTLSDVKNMTTTNQSMLNNWNNDQTFLHFLSKDSLFFNIAVFFLLGILLAFLPCSLPLIPILSGIIIQRATGYKAAIIALSFVLSMAAVYALMGIVVAEIGYSFQRWFQSPIIISFFALLFVGLALNLFGLYQLNLPQKLTQKLHHLQNQQKTGTILGASIMGILSALIVGPCMSAPLAGALLFVSQSQSAILGGIYLFILGLGLGLPLFIASVFGSRLLPKPGLWMDRLKTCFGFVMLMMALYFIRPMLPSVWYFAIFALICVLLTLYLFNLFIQSSKINRRILASIFMLLTVYAGYWNVQQAIDSTKIQHSERTHLAWQKVSTLDELNVALAHAKQQQKPIIIDVYADWCVACQPIERDVFPRQDVQDALQKFSLIQLNLTQYHASQDLILKQHEILGPPTLLLLNQSGEEYRNLRLTGTFSAQQLLQHINTVQKY